jgi:hypothetical protein
MSNESKGDDQPPPGKPADNPPEDKPEFKPPEGFGPDFVNRAAGDKMKK